MLHIYIYIYDISRLRVNNFTTNEDIATEFEVDLPRCVRNLEEKNVLLFKFRCNNFFGGRIIKETPGSVASGTPCRISYLRKLCEVGMSALLYVTLKILRMNCSSSLSIFQRSVQNFYDIP